MNSLAPSANIWIDSDPGQAPVRSIVAQRLDSAFEIRLQDVLWSSSGHSTVHAGSRCIFELLLPANTAVPPAEYFVVGNQGQRKELRRLNFVAPLRTLDLHWSPGGSRSLICIFDPVRLGILAGQVWDWCEVDPLAAMDIGNDRLEATLRWLCEELLQPSFASELQITSMLSLLAVETQRHFGLHRPNGERCPGKLSMRQLAIIKDYIEYSSAGSVCLQELGAACGLSSRELPIMFKNTMGETLRSFVASCRIARAKVLLADSRLLIKQVAWRSGFDSASAFSAAFFKATGIRPRQYRDINGIGVATPDGN